MVSLALSPSLRLDSCWRVEVVKGGAGFLVEGFSSVWDTCQGLPVRRFFKAKASASLRTTTSLPRLKLPVVASKSLPVATRLPATVISFVSKGLFSCSRVALRSQYRADLKARLSRSLWTRRRTATDCTLPAESPQAIFFQSRGERV